MNMNDLTIMLLSPPQGKCSLQGRASYYELLLCWDYLWDDLFRIRKTTHLTTAARMMQLENMRITKAYQYENS